MIAQPHSVPRCRKRATTIKPRTACQSRLHGPRCRCGCGISLSVSSFSSALTLSKQQFHPRDPSQFWLSHVGSFVIAIHQGALNADPGLASGDSYKVHKYFSQQRKPSNLWRDQIKIPFYLGNPFKPIGHAETKTGLQDVRVAEMANYRFKVPQFGVG